MDFDLPEETRDLQEMVREFAAKEIAPNAAQWSETETFPTKIFTRLGELGLMGMLVPEEYGGAGSDMVSYVAVMEELGAADQSVASSWNAHSTIATLPLLTYGTETQKQRWLAPLARGEAIGAFGLTEPGAGSDAAGITTTARRADGGWLVNGTKMFITNAGTDISQGVTLLATTGRGEDGRKRFATFYVPTGTPGYSTGAKLKKLGWHAMDTRELVFDDCWIPEDHLIGEEGNGLRQFLSVLDKGRISVAALGLSLARAALALAVKHATERHQFGRPLSAFQAVAHKIADIGTEFQAARWMVYRAAWLADQGRPYGTEAAMAKLYASEAANRAASQAVQIHGGYGYVRESEISRFYADAKILEIGEGTNEIQRDVIARALLKQP
ncbi:acyl-CoA dehydrogenase family protein [Streptomyces sp. WI04-05B]|uniref:acyl-CoA dehydrogenase family protein n=1 Tax=Streptomyces TaxID=1883 RepID=UPI0029A14B3D|nr:MULTISPECIES: acyl-CoA dehydrogenase family protein [unclassified Streptomyces]MDX2545065.1 acyl-CoA dehydrogenase family protein [Streptomyces sp. WI04-05B]MDX2587556.1 acyl-CoA dehydrogenase family protein [Streptomyces sp. WI04-05A]MDX3748264.1 acyl-CoA dehydrogenase family protein [Streptomyces sp. AK08-02]